MLPELSPWKVWPSACFVKLFADLSLTVELGAPLGRAQMAATWAKSCRNDLVSSGVSGSAMESQNPPATEDRAACFPKCSHSADRNSLEDCFACCFGCLFSLSLFIDYGKIYIT